ncbi:putative kinetochore protein [Phialemonium atrogriseum]|uniref:Kinetochore protein n=1 Tax=Phialemonium atrogriseum TaxID=1093897 RepID=A0AAJ0FGD0_9PEZI|nr:putative kinetochore protein [Phialemonium atrogriseum]KAK1766482.1 putative kinetochore protein [Phialemonium atrogriseum]
MESSTAHRKIELQSAEDFTYLINNVRRAAADSINAAFPPVDGADGHGDELRTQIENLVNEYITRTFTLAAPNLTINGLPVDDPSPFLLLPPAGTAALSAAGGGPEERHEPFDGRRRARVEDLAREEEDLLREIAALKRRVPVAAARDRAERFRAGLLADEDALECARARAEAGSRWGRRLGKEEDGRGGEEVEEGGSAARADALLELGLLERQDGVEGGFAGAVAALGRLKRELPATVAKMERARVAGEYVITER